MTCIAAILARNEADRYLREAVESLRPLCDEILVLDDGSTDTTTQLATSLGCIVRPRDGEAMWGNESPARQELWEWGAERCGDGWLYISDADHETCADPAIWLGLLASWQVTAWALPLYDCWDGPTTFRADGFWQGYQRPRPWLFRPSAVAGTWSDRGIHCGHAPVGDWTVGAVPDGVYIKHYGWMRRADREAKHSRYASVGGILTDFESAHLHSALD